MFNKVRRKIREWLQVEKGGANRVIEAEQQGCQIGKNVDFAGTPNFGSEPYLIKTGDNTTISFDVAFVTHDAATRVIRNLPDGDPKTGYFGSIVIGKNCFIGCRTTILAGVHIGDNCIIGAGSIVNKDIPANTIAAGNPCKVICSLNEYRQKHEKDFIYLNHHNQEEKKKYLLKLFEHDLKI